MSDIFAEKKRKQNLLNAGLFLKQGLRKDRRVTRQQEFHHYFPLWFHPPSCVSPATPVSFLPSRRVIQHTVQETVN